MLMDKNLQFSAAQALTTTALSTNAYDLLQGLAIPSAGAYTAGSNFNFGPNASVFGEDLGVGRGVGTPRVVGTVIAALTGGTSLQVQFQGAPDSGSLTLSGYTWTTYIQTDAIAASLLTANTRIFSFDWPKRKVGQALPRFVVLNYLIVGTFGAGTISSDVTLGEDDATGTLQAYPDAFTVGA
jgi:hypothetical protein